MSRKVKREVWHEWWEGYVLSVFEYDDGKFTALVAWVGDRGASKCRGVYEKRSSAIARCWGMVRGRLQILEAQAADKMKEARDG